MKNLVLAITTIASLLYACSRNHSVGHEHHATTAAANYADSVNNGIIPEDTLRGSPIRTTMKTISGSHIHIVYGSPGVKGRIIWGGLVPYDRIWVTGAHSATTIDVFGDVYLGGQLLAKGKYAFFTIPGKEKWTVVINRNFDQHLTDNYAERDDVLRFEVIPEVIPTPVQRLTYSIEKLDEKKGEIVFTWEKVRIRVPIEIR